MGDNPPWVVTHIVDIPYRANFCALKNLVDTTFRFQTAKVRCKAITSTLANLFESTQLRFWFERQPFLGYESLSPCKTLRICSEGGCSKCF